MDELIELSAVDAVQALRRGDVSPFELLDAAEQRVRTVEPRAHAMINTCFDRARAHAARLPRASTDPTVWLAGLPVSVKDVVDVSGVPTTYGCAGLSDSVAASSSEAIRRLESVGALIVGKTSLPEFCSGADTANDIVGRTINPWDPSVTCGASSGGAAVSVATGEVWCAHGEDTAGSIRIPAAFCSVVGIRPSPGLVPVPVDRGGGPAADFEVHGPIARDVGDAALFLDALAGSGRLDAARGAPANRFQHAAAHPVLPERIAFTADYQGAVPGVSADIRTTCEAAVLRLDAAGCSVVRTAPALDGPRAAIAFGTLLVHRAMVRFGWAVDRLGAVTGPGIRAEVAAGRGVPAAQLHAAEAERVRFARSFADLFDEVDLLVTPAFGAPPWTVAETPEGMPDAETAAAIAAAWPLAWLVTLSGCPSVCLPAGFDPAGHPVGLQLVGPPGGDVALMHAAAAIELELDVSRGAPREPANICPTPREVHR